MWYWPPMHKTFASDGQMCCKFATQEPFTLRCLASFQTTSRNAFNSGGNNIGGNRPQKAHHLQEHTTCISSHHFGINQLSTITYPLYWVSFNQLTHCQFCPGNFSAEETQNACQVALAD